MISLLERRPDLLPSIAVAVTGISWGLFWLPMRAFDALGLTGVWASVAIFAAAVVFLSPMMIARRRSLVAGGVDLLFTGMIAGAALVLYATALVLTDVVYTILLFYLTPVWSTLLGRALLGEQITRARLLALVMGIAGLFVILGVNTGLPMPRNAGDWMALFSGIAWAYASLRIYRRETVHAREWTSAFFIGGFLVAMVIVLLPISTVGAHPTASTLKAAAPWVLLFVGAYLIPIMLALLWSTRQLNPGRVGLLLMGEVVVGVASAAILTGEPFGGRELAGTILIVGAGLVEVLQAQTQPRTISQ